MELYCKKSLPTNLQDGLNIKVSGYIILTLLFMLIGTSALWFAKNTKPPDYTVRDYTSLSHIKSAILSNITLEMNALSSTSTIGGLTDYPGIVICPLDHDKLMTKDEGYAKGSCHNASIKTPSKGLVPWRSLGLNNTIDSTGAMFWLIVDPDLTEGKKAYINSERQSTLYWRDRNHPVAAIIASPQKSLTGQRRTALSKTNTPIDNIDHYLEIETVNDTLNGRSINIIKPSPSGCETRNECNDLFVTISRNEWLDAVEHRIANILLYCINKFIKKSQTPESVSSSDSEFPTSLLSSYPSGFCYSQPYPVPENSFSGTTLGQFKILSDSGQLDPNLALLDTIKKDKKAICENIFNRYTSPSLYPSVSIPFSLPSPTCPSPPLSVPSISVTPLPVSFPSQTKNEGYNAIVTPTRSASAHTCNDHWMYQWNNLIFFDIRKDLVTLPSSALPSSASEYIRIKDNINNQCWGSDIMVLLASEPLDGQSRPSTPVCKKNASKPLYALGSLNNLFEGKNITPHAGTFEVRKRSSDFNDVIRFNRRKLLDESDC